LSIKFPGASLTKLLNLFSHSLSGRIPELSKAMVSSAFRISSSSKSK
jgi:hypothetical protein